MTLATTWTNNEKHVTSLDDLMPLICQQLAEGKSVSFTPTGISMMPMLHHNRDNVVISPVSDGLKMYDIALYQRDNGDYVLHRMVGTNMIAGESGAAYTMLGDNQFAKEYGIRDDQIIGIVTEFTRDGRVHKVDEIGYKAYCRVWYHSRQFRYFLKRVKRKLRSIIK